MTENSSHNTKDPTNEKPQDTDDTLEALAAENRELRERITDLEATLSEVRDELEEIERQNGTRNGGMEQPGTPEADDGALELVTSGGQPTKVIGRLSDTDAIGVLGEATGSGGASRGVLGLTQSSDDGATGVRGEANTSSSGETYGIYGKTNGDIDLRAAGVYADATNTAGTGVLARANGGAGDGVNAVASENGYSAIWGNHSATSGRSAHGVFAKTSSPDAAALYARSGGFAAIEADGKLIVNGNITQNDSTEQKTAGPIAKGYINSDGTIANAVNVDSVTFDSSNTRYEITLTGESYVFDEYATVVTTKSLGFTETGSTNNNLLVTVYDETGSKIQDSFQFVTFALPSGAVTTSTSSAESTSIDEIRGE